jgi:crotonobetainyl-CoA:carnitine CoA-transferase CaiB-like acyl-CoA transferase
MSGFMAYTGEIGGVPTKAGVAVADIFAGSLATQAILAALYEREKTGIGRRIEINLLEAMIALGTYQVSRYLGANEDAERLGNEHRSIVPYGTFATKDGFVNIAGGTDALFVKLCHALEATDLLKPKYASNAARVELRVEVTKLLEQHLKRYSSSEAVSILQAAGVPCGPIWSVAQVIESEFVQARGVTTKLEHPDLGTVKLTTPPFEFDGQRLAVRKPPPTLNQHEQEILEELRISSQKLL